MHESYSLAVHVLLHAVANHARAFVLKLDDTRLDAVHLQAEMMYAAARIALEEFRDGRIGARRLHELDLRIAEIDVRHAHALLLVHADFADFQAVFFFELARGGLEVRHNDGHVAESGNHFSPLAYPELNYLVASERGDLRVIHAELLLQDLVGVLAERRRRAAHRRRRCA